MSADQQRLTNAIRSIVKTGPEIRSLLDAADNKGGKVSAAGVGVSDAEESRLCCDGSTSANANPGTSERDPDSSAQSGLDSSDPADLTNGDGTLSGVTDCETGEPICFDGAGFIPPDGWEDGAPVDPTYEEGYYFTASVYRGSVYNTDQDWDATSPPLQSCLQARQWIADNHPYLETVDDVSPFCPDTASTYSTSKTECIATLEADQNHPCGMPPPLMQYWPEDGCVNLIVKGGKIVGSKYDPENDGSYSAPRTSIDLCSDTDQISLAPSADGGWKTINSTTDNGYLYNNKNERIAHIDGNEYSDPSV